MSHYAPILDQLADYDVTQLVAGPPALYRGVNKEGAHVLFMVTEDGPKEHERCARLEHAYALRTRLAAPWAARPYALLRENGFVALALRDPGGTLLRARWRSPQKLERFLRAAMAIATAVESLHEAGLVHCDLNPDCILLDNADESACLLGFGHAMMADRSDRETNLHRASSGAIEYMAPELCGRMERLLDCRADLYSLGCLFYEMLTGVLPFTGVDRMALAHAQLAKQPMRPSAYAPGLPRQVEAVVMKLLAKNPNDRYQSAAGLLADLMRCLNAGPERNAAAVFPLDLHASVAISRHAGALYGRRGQMDALDATLRRVSTSGAVELVFVAGYSGSGKSALVDQWASAIGTTSISYARGVCEQLDSTQPYGALARALERLIRPILGQEDASFTATRNRLTACMGARAEILYGLLPDLKLILGTLSSDDETQFNVDRAVYLRTIADLLKSVLQPERPLVLFFDDMQWVDEGTLTVLDYLTRDSDLSHVMLIAAFRSNEVTPGHALERLIAETKDRHQVIAVEPLDRGDMARLVGDTLGCKLDASLPVIDIIREKTGGNPFFTIQLAAELASEGLIEFEEKGALRLRDVDRIRAKLYSDNVADLMLLRFARLGEAARDALQVFACLGAAAKIADLAAAASLTKQALEASLREAINASLIDRDADRLRFTHDRIREAAYASMRESEQAALHLEIGRRLATRLREDEPSDELFVVANQINRGASHVVSPEERKRFAYLNLLAGERAKAATAYTSALVYFETAAALIDESTDEDTAQWTEFHRADVECLIGTLAPAEARLAALGRKPVSMALRAELTRLTASLQTAQNRQIQALTTGLDFLARLGVNIEERPSDSEVDRLYRQLRSELGDRSIAQLGENAWVEDPVWRCALDVLADLIPPALFFNANLLDVILLNLALLSLRHGLSDSAAYGFVCLNLVFAERYGDYRTGYEFAQLAVDVVDRCKRSRYKARIYMRFGSLVIPWSRPAQDAMPYIEQAKKVAKADGDLVFDVSGARNVVSVLLLAGRPLDEVLAEAKNGLNVARLSRFFLYSGVFRAQIQLVEQLGDAGRRDTADHAGDEEYQRDIDAVRANNTSVGFAYWTCMLQASFISGDFEAALEAEVAARRSIGASRMFLELIEYRFFGALTRAKLCEMAATQHERAAHREALDAHCAALSAWAHVGPANLTGRAALVDAEIARLDGRAREAEHLYNKAIRHAHERRILHVEALACELAAGFHRQQGRGTIADAYLRDASHAYAWWGANAKVRAMTERGLKTEPSAAAPMPAFDYPSQQLDIAAIIKASSALSSEIVLSRLIETLALVTLEHAGAQRCVLALNDEGGLQIHAEAVTRAELAEVNVVRREISSEDLPLTLVRTAIRTGQPLALGSAATEGGYTRDDYVRRTQAKSVLCLPLLKQGGLVGVIFLENRLSESAFTEDKIAVLSVLGAQAAIALENARLYQDLVEQNQRIAHTEEALRNAMAELARVTRLTTMGQLVASIAHEISQPVSAIHSSASAAVHWLEREPPALEEARKMLTLVAGESLRASSIIHGIRELAKNAPPTLTVFDLRRAVAEALLLAGAEVENHQVEVDNAIAPEFFVKGDRVQVQQVALNLIVNAVEAMAGVDSRARVLELSSRHVGGGRAEITVADSGPGLQACVEGSLFEPFVTTKATGMGLGLSICRSIIERHGGTLEFEPNTPHGARFVFSLAAAFEAAGGNAALER
ncbi:AAA family ATPase [Paraburkholderia sp. J10-1]|uniref:trifunctional serine/threonine-protein kinase/ATP-binding protein/sensor histidine kinase n=1 Tax=Paraburkholderia sp. J10-1 TaxID=2805430 RepID=UPI002AB7859F|nr:AAA family ATPase [Paraburkholderia sp. J10-1]